MFSLPWATGLPREGPWVGVGMMMTAVLQIQSLFLCLSLCSRRLAAGDCIIQNSLDSCLLLSWIKLTNGSQENGGERGQGISSMLHLCFGPTLPITASLHQSDFELLPLLHFSSQWSLVFISLSCSLGLKNSSHSALLVVSWCFTSPVCSLSPYCYYCSLPFCI